MSTIRQLLLCPLPYRSAVPCFVLCLNVNVDVAGGAPDAEQALPVGHGVDVLHVPGEHGHCAPALHVPEAGEGDRRGLGEREKERESSSFFGGGGIAAALLPAFLPGTSVSFAPRKGRGHGCRRNTRVVQATRFATRYLSRAGLACTLGQPIPCPVPTRQGSTIIPRRGEKQERGATQARTRGSAPAPQNGGRSLTVHIYIPGCVCLFPPVPCFFFFVAAGGGCR